MTDSIGKLRRVPLREVWKHEAYDFTQWLEENIEVLNDIIEVNLVSVDREQAAGSFSVDLLAEDANGSTVVIENQLEKSNHDHLGKVITYLTMMQANIGIWIVGEPRPEHVTAVNWLNESTAACFYLIKVEAVQIGDSMPAPLLTLIVGPSEDSASIHEHKQEQAERHKIRNAFWTQLLSHPKAKLHAHITPSKSSWVGVASGVRGLSFNYGIKKDQSFVELYIDRGKDSGNESKLIFDQLQSHEHKAEVQLEQPIAWQRLDSKRACRIKIDMKGGYRSPESEWGSIQDRMVETMCKFAAFFSPLIKKLDS